MDNNELLKGIQQNISEQKVFIEEMRSYLLSPTGKVNVSTGNFSDLVDGIRVKDITSPEQFDIGITVLRVSASKDTDFGEHDHEKQSQIIYVIQGQVYDMQANIMFKTGQSFLVPKANIHAVRYFSGTEAVIVYMPKLFMA